MNFEIPKRNFREEKDERIEDVEQAHFMALIENAKQSEAGSYANYLEHPEVYVGSEHSRFRNLEEDGIKPEDLKEIGRNWSESAGDIYAHSKKVEILQKEGKRWEIFKLCARDGFKGMGHAIADVFGTIKDTAEFLTSSEKRAELKMELKHDLGIEKADPKEARKWSLKKHSREIAAKSEFTTAIKFLESTVALCSKADDVTNVAEISNELSGLFRKQAEEYYIPKKEEKTEDAKENKDFSKEDSNIGAEFVDYIFNAEADFYDDFLGGKSFLGGSIKKHFESMKEKGIDPDEIRKNGKYWKKIMGDLKTWNDRLRKVDDKQLEKEIKENLIRFNQIIFGFKKYKKGEENKYMQDYVVSMYKFFKTCYVQARRKSAEKSGAKAEFAFGNA